MAAFVVVLADSRVLSVTDAFGTTDTAVLKAIVEAIDLNAATRR